MELRFLATKPQLMISLIHKNNHQNMIKITKFLIGCNARSGIRKEPHNSNARNDKKTATFKNGRNRKTPCTTTSADHAILKIALQTVTDGSGSTHGMMTGRAKQRWAYYRKQTLSIANPKWTVLGAKLGIHCENHAPKRPSSDTSCDSY
jgi:hypothetical protein